jgi:hypothetical protein
MATKIVKCQSCNTDNTGLENFCRNCGTSLGDPFQNQNPQNQQMQQPFNQGNQQQIPGADKKMLAGILGIALGVMGLGVGAHKFVMGYQQEGIILLSVYLIGIIITVVTCGFGFFIGIPMMVIPGIIGIIEGIIYLTKSDQEFVDTYINGKKPWF